MVKINIKCPTCSQNRDLNINEDEIELKPSGLTSINIVKNFTCEHTYIAYIDRHYNVRDYFDLDYSVELPKIITEDQTMDIVEDSIMSFDYDLIKLNLTQNILTVILKAILSKKPCVFIKDKDILYDYVIPFFKTINENAFEFDMEIISEETYQNSKSKFKKYVIVNSSAILNNPYKFIDIKKLKVEKRIINAFIVELDIRMGLKIIKNHIRNANDLAVKICDYVKNHVNEKHIYAKNIIDYLESTYGIIISSQYLDFLIEVVHQYFEIPVKLSMSRYAGVF